MTLEGCRLLQQEEQEVLQSIYPECIYKDMQNVQLEISVEFAESQQVIIADESMTQISSKGQGGSVNETQCFSLSALPPVMLHLKLPAEYPLGLPPEIVSIRTRHSWYSGLPQLKQILLEMWVPGEGVLYNWVEFFRTGEFLQPLNIIADGIIRFSYPTPHLLATVLNAYDSSLKHSKFLHTTYSCAICLTQLKGAKCFELACSHVFCHSCLEDFWTLCITEGDVGRVGCPDPTCIKTGREASEEEVVRVVSEENVIRWRWLRQKRDLERDPTIIHCPIPICQTPVPQPPLPEGEESGWVRLRTCSNCAYSFCSFCKRTWHGPILGCPISATEAVVFEYLALPEDSPGRASIETRFGKNLVVKLVAKYHEEQANKQWLELSTMPCPGCHIHVEKSLGCNHMTCVKCRQHFCYQCGAKLDASNPYEHFAVRGHRCYGKLFEFHSEDDEWQPVEGFDIT